MLKRLLAVIMVSCLFPVMANAAIWSLSTAARSSGGTVQVGGGVPQTAAQGMQTTYYSTNTPVSVTITPNTGYIISQVNYNGTTTYRPSQTSYTVNGPLSQNVYAWFMFQTFSVSASISGGIGGDAIAPSGVTGLNYGTVFTTPKVFIFSPSSASYEISSISGIPVGATQSPAVPVAGQPVTVTFPIGFAVTSDIALVGTFVARTPVADAGIQQTAFVNNTVVLNGASSNPGQTGISSYAWSQVSGPAVTLGNPATAQASFIPALSGTYSFSLTLMPGGSTSVTTVTVFDSYTAAVRLQCYNCHKASNVGITAKVFDNWSSSGHKSKGVICARCHVGADTGGHPGPISSATVSTTSFDFIGTVGTVGSGNFCVTCHSPTIVTDFAASKHSIRAGAASCSFCHVLGVHNPKVACTDCHTPDNTYGLVWPPAAYPFHSSFTGSANVCKVCHTTHNPKVLSIKTSCP
jgi:hypothetical protein